MKVEGETIVLRIPLKVLIESPVKAVPFIFRTAKFTKRELEVIAGIRDGLPNKQIAARLNIAERTVKFHVSSVLAKTKLQGRMEILRKLPD